MPVLPDYQATLTPMQAQDIETWTEHATEALEILSLSSPATRRLTPIRGTSVSLAIPLDEATTPSRSRVTVQAPATATAVDGPPRPVSSGYTKREPLRRDSLKRREALLKGKEGSRRRQKWENDRLLSNPWAQPPLPSDWEVQPTYQRHTVPYYLAPLWDTHVQAKVQAQSQKSKKKANSSSSVNSAAETIPRELREKLKRARAARGLLQNLEEEIRVFVQKWQEKDAKATEEGFHDVDSEDLDSEDEEIVFVGRGGRMKDEHEGSKRKRENGKMQEEQGKVLKKEMLVFESMEDEDTGRFARWLVHSIATYYNLRTWSITTGDPSRREAYVGIKDLNMRAGRRRLESSSTPESAVVEPLPRPLWCLV